jgi:hypothetical protein
LPVALGELVEDRPPRRVRERAVDIGHAR